MNLTRSIVLLMVMAVPSLVSLGGCRNASVARRQSLTAEAAQQYDHWATPVEVDGVPNMRCVHSGLYRGGQPSSKGFDELNLLGVKTVINLRTNDSDAQVFGDAPFAYHRIPMSAFDMRSRHVADFLRIVCDADAQPVFLHCQRGADRTGVLIAMYRVIVDGWSREQAIAEMTRGGTRFHPICGNLVEFVRNSNVKQIVAEAGIDIDQHRVAVGEPRLTIAD